MEIGPIPAIRVEATTKVLKPGPRFSELLEIENAPEPMKGTFSQAEDQPARGQDSESETQEPAQPDGAVAEPQDSGSKVNLFA